MYALYDPYVNAVFGSVRFVLVLVLALSYQIDCKMKEKKIGINSRCVRVRCEYVNL